jgi:hypothetical protein
VLPPAAAVAVRVVGATHDPASGPRCAPPLVALVVLLVVPLLVIGPSCTSTGPGRASGAPPVPVASRLAVPPAAARTPDAPGLNVEDLSARVRDALQATSGVEVVDELSVRRELAACTEAPCPDALASRYRAAGFMVASSVSRVGDVFLASVRVQRGIHELARAHAEDSDPRASLEKAAHEAGRMLRAALTREGAPELVHMPGAAEVDTADTEGGEIE